MRLNATGSIHLSIFLALLQAINKSLERLVYVHVNTRLMDNISDVDYEEMNVD